MEPPIYTKKPIRDLNSLSRFLGLSVREMMFIAKKSDNFYFPAKEIIKPDGRRRRVFRVHPKLKSLQETILKRIFAKVEYPTYLQGSLPSLYAPRGHLNNAKLHAGAKIVVREDISDFFDSIRATHVKHMWARLFHFSDAVSDILVNLTTYQGRVPQGAATSPYIANLLFWDNEPRVVAELSTNGNIYTRYVDDVHVSNKHRLSRKDIEDIRKVIKKLVESKSLCINRKKTRIQTSGRRITVHKLVTNSGELTMTRQDRSKNRAAVRQMEWLKESLYAADAVACKRFATVYGKVSYWMQVEPTKARPCFMRLKQIIRESPIPLMM